MKRYKILITLLLVVLSFTCLFSFSVSAAYREVTLKQLVDAGSLYCSYSYEDGKPNPDVIYDVDVTANTTHWTEAVRLYLPSDDTYLTSLSLNILSNNNSLFSSLPSGAIFSVSTGRFCLASTDFGFLSSADYSNVARLRMTFRFQLDDNTFQYLHSNWTYPSKWGDTEPSFRIPYIEFSALNFSFDLPYNVTSLYSVNFEIDFTTNSSTPNLDCGGVSYFMVWGGKFVFNIGSFADAPIYEGPDTSGYDEYHASEDALLNDTADGRQSVGSAIDDGFSALAPGGTLYNSLYFWRELMNDAINDIPMLSPMITVSLAFGLVVFILGGSLVKVLTKEPDDKVPRRRGKGD